MLVPTMKSVMNWGDNSTILNKCGLKVSRVEFIRGYKNNVTQNVLTKILICTLFITIIAVLLQFHVINFVFGASLQSN